MRSLFLKIFLWFWLSAVLVSLATAFIAAIMQSNSQRAWQNQALVDTEAVRSLDIYERERAGALKRHFEDLPKKAMYAYLLDEQGTEVLGQKLPEHAIRFMHKGFDKSFPTLLLGAVKADPTGKRFVTPLSPLKQHLDNLLGSLPSRNIRKMQVAPRPYW